jgi:quinol monooxygenase YgiN
MIQATVKMVLPPGRMKEALAILGPIAERTKTERGCLDCQLHRDALEEHVLVLENRWADEENLQRYLRSAEYRDLLLVMEMAEKPPEVRFDTVTHSTGFETVEKARTS